MISRAGFTPDLLPGHLILPVAAAVAAALLSPSVCPAQAFPYQSAARGAVGTGLGQEPLTRGLVFEPRVETAIQYINNINLATRSAEQINTAGLELTPGVYLSYSSDHLTGAIDYSVVGQVWDESDYNTVSQSGVANGRWTAIPGWLFLDGQGSVIVGVIDPSVSLNYGGLGIFNPGNLSQQATASVMPTLDRQFGDLEFITRYSYGRVWYFDQGEQADQIGFIGQDNSKDQSVDVSLGTASTSSSRLTGRAFYLWQKSTYENALPYKYEKLGADAAWEISPKFSLVGDGGVQSDLDESTTQGGLGSGFWSAGFRWDPNQNTSFEARFGRQFFGTSYLFRLNQRSRFLEMYGSYSETPQVQTQILSLGQFQPGELPPGVDPGVDFGQFNASPYIAKDLLFGIAAIGSRTRVSLDAYQMEQNYITTNDLVPTQPNQDHKGISLGVTRELASNLSADLGISYTNFSSFQASADPSEGQDDDDYDTQVVLRLNRAQGSKLETSLECGYLRRSGGEGYDGWWTGIRARWNP